jgi:hypothetical protein
MKSNRKDCVEAGVKQGYWLSPLLFNLCLETLLMAGSINCEQFGTFVGPSEDRIGFAIQACADDVIFILREAEGVQRRLGIIEAFVNCS